MGELIMKIRVALIDNDINYLEKIVELLNAKYNGKFVFYTYTSEELAKDDLKYKKIDVLLVNGLIDINETQYNQKFEIGYLVETRGIEKKRIVNLKLFSYFLKTVA